MTRFILLVFLSICISENIYPQTCRDASVELYATVQVSPPQIVLNWVANTSATSYIIYRKLKTDFSWYAVLGTAAATATQYTDNTISAGVSYEYRVIRMASGFSGYGYINTGINIPAQEFRGTMILVVDSTMVSFNAAEINRLTDDLVGDGWKVIRHDVTRTAPVTFVKSLITTDYSSDPVNTKGLFLLGHVPVPYSGNINPDGHPDHQGAWPADVYYGDMDGPWTDAGLNNVTATDARNHNVPGDGKFDQSYIASDIELQVGRVDFSNMPAFSVSEEQLLKNYLNKDHNYRHKVFNPIHRALVDDHFFYFAGEAFAASGWKNFGPLVGPSNTSAAGYFTSMSGGSYLWSYACGPGSYTSAYGVGNTSDFANANLQGVFTMLFGSYFGDWDSQNNFLRAPLAQGLTLTNVWSGRPHWVFHHMALGENIGYDVRLSQNNNNVYFNNNSYRLVHMALMGDPSLRNDIIAPVSNLVADASGVNCNISWTASTDNVLGYNIYRKSVSSPDFARKNQNLVTGTSYTDSCLVYPGLYTYMVRAVALTTSPSGTYYNLSQGISDTAWHPDNYHITASASVLIQNSSATFTNTSANATQVQWSFGDGNTSTIMNPVHTYSSGTYSVTLIAGNGCTSDTTHLVINVSQVNNLQGKISYKNNTASGMHACTVMLLNSSGDTVAIASTNTAGFYSFTNLPNGTYTLHAKTTLAPGGINSSDALMALMHFAQFTTLTGLNYIAGNVDGNTIINSVDALMISKKFTGQIANFPAGTWYFESPSVTLSGNALYTVNFKGICYGDCNGSYIP